MLEVLIAVAVLTPIVLLFLLALMVTVHFFWLSHAGRWPPDVPPTAVERQPGSGAAEARGGRSVRTRPDDRRWLQDAGSRWPPA
jgi:hypothetical protein